MYLYRMTFQASCIYSHPHTHTKRDKGRIVLTDIINKTYAWQKFTKTCVISFWEVPSVQYEWHPGLLPVWIIAFFLPVNVPAISIACSISSTFLCQIILCYCCVSLKVCHVSIQRCLSICLQRVPEPVTAHRRIQAAGIPEAVKDVIDESLHWGSEAAKFRRCDGIASYSLSWKFHFQRYLETLTMLIGSKKYWCTDSARCLWLHCLWSRDGWSLVGLAHWQKHPTDLHQAMDKLVHCGFFHQASSSKSGVKVGWHTELWEGFFQIHAGQKLTSECKWGL